jgi:hypothetical protein
MHSVDKIKKELTKNKELEIEINKIDSMLNNKCGFFLIIAHFNHMKRALFLNNKLSFPPIPHI